MSEYLPFDMQARHGDSCAGCGKKGFGKSKTGYALNLDQMKAGQVFDKGCIPAGSGAAAASAGEDVDLAKLNKEALKTLAIEAGLEVKSRATKAQILDALIEAAVK